MLKGPKAILSSAIADALNEYFVVDPHTIQSNLLKDTKIVLRDVELRPSTTVRPNINTFGNQTSVSLSGTVDEVAFTWSWNVGTAGTNTKNDKSWVKDAVLTIKGAKFYIDLTETDQQQHQLQDQVDDDDAHAVAPAEDEESQQRTNLKTHSGAEKTSNHTVGNVLDRTESADSDTKKEIKSQGGFTAYIQNQVRLVLDALTLSIQDFEVTVSMPSPKVAKTKQSDQDDDGGGDDTGAGNHTSDDVDDYTISIVAGARRFEVVSHGRQYNPDVTEHREPLSETMTLEHFYMNVLETYCDRQGDVHDGHGDEHANVESNIHHHRQKRDRDPSSKTTTIHTYPLQDPFNYYIETIRTDGQRFSTFMTGLKVKGTSMLQGPGAVDDSGDVGGQEHELSFYLDRPQLEAFGQLSGLILAPPTSSSMTTSTQEVIGSGKYSSSSSISNDDNENVNNESDQTTASHDGGEYSTIDLTLNGASLHYMGTSTVRLESLAVHYVVDGTQLRGSIGSFTYRDDSTNGSRGTEVVILDVDANARPSIDITLGQISTLYIPQTMELEQEMRMVRLTQTGKTWSVTGDQLHVILPKVDEERLQKEIDAAAAQRKRHQVNVGQLSLDDVAGVDSDTGNKGRENQSQQRLHSGLSSSDISTTVSKFWVAPFPASIQFANVSHMKQGQENTRVELQKLSIWISPKDDQSATEVAASIGALQSDLATGTDLTVFSSVPADMSAKRFDHFEFSAGVISVTAGYSVQDWLRTFSFIGLRSSTTRGNTIKPVYYNLPDANIAPMKIQVQYNALSVVSVKQTTIHIPLFKGNKKTTTKDVSTFYTEQILSKSTDFLKNAEVLGLNVQNAGMFALGTTLAAANPFAGVAVMVGADAVKASVEAGKRARKAKEGAHGTIGDFFIGIGYAAVEATESGAIRRGKKAGQQLDPLDWMIGVSASTGQYLGDNKEKFGQAGGATAGMITGAVIAGPVGLVVGGIIGGISSGAVVRGVSNMQKDRQQRREARKMEYHAIEQGTLRLEK